MSIDPDKNNENKELYSGHSHSFDTGIALNLGLHAAVVFNHIVYWLRINAAKNNNFHDGKTWMYETQKEISDFLSYLSLEEVKKSIVKLLDFGLLIKGNYNKNPFDKTNWYTTADQSIINPKSLNDNKHIQKTLTKAPYGAIDNALRRDPERRTAPCIYDNKNTEQEEQQQQPLTPSSPTAVVREEIVVVVVPFSLEEEAKRQALAKYNLSEELVKQLVCVPKEQLCDACVAFDEYAEGKSLSNTIGCLRIAITQGWKPRVAKDKGSTKEEVKKGNLEALKKNNRKKAEDLKNKHSFPEKYGFHVSDSVVTLDYPTGAFPLSLMDEDFSVILHGYIDTYKLNN